MLYTQLNIIELIIRFSFQVVANYYGVSQQFVDVPGKYIRWAGNRDSPPPDVPECGFDGSLCTDGIFEVFKMTCIY